MRIETEFGVFQDGDIIDEEHGIRLGDEDLIAAIKDSHQLSDEDWDMLPDEDKVVFQLSWVQPPHTYH